MKVIFLDFDGVLNSATYLARVGGEGWSSILCRWRCSKKS